MKPALFAVFALLAAAASSVDVNVDADQHVSASDAPSYASVGDALMAAGDVPSLSTLLAAIQAANLTIPADATWTVLSPTNAAFEDPAILEKTGLSAAQLLEPANKEALIQVLSYHVVPAAAVASTELTDGQMIETLLQNATLTVSLMDGGVMIQDANVVTPDIKAGNSIIHVIDKVLLPAALIMN